MGPVAVGGLTLKDLPTGQGIQQIMTLLGHVYHDTVPGRMLLIAVQNLQMEEGIKMLLLQDPTKLVPYPTQCWLTSLLEFIGENQTSIELTEAWNFNKPLENDTFLMDVFLQSRLYSVQELQQLNLVQLHLQVATLLDISSACGKQ